MEAALKLKLKLKVMKFHILYDIQTIVGNITRFVTITANKCCYHCYYHYHVVAPLPLLLQIDKATIIFLVRNKFNAKTYNK